MRRKGPAPNEQRIVLDRITWQKFETLLQEMGLERTTRLTYDRGTLELMNPLEDHERCRKLIESLILVLVDELKLPVESFTAPLLKRSDLGCAIEPDTAYYIQTANRMQHREAIDLSVDPVPDLLQEVSLTKPTIDPLLVYAQLGIPEVWRYITQSGENFFKGRMVIYWLEGDRYIESSASAVFPFLPSTKVLEFIEHSDAIGLMKALKLLRAWIQETVK